MNTPPELRDLMRLYAGKLGAGGQDPQSHPADALDMVVSELRSLATAESQRAVPPVIILRSSQKLPWILGVILAALVGFLVARLTSSGPSLSRLTEARMHPPRPLARAPSMMVWAAMPWSQLGLSATALSSSTTT